MKRLAFLLLFAVLAVALPVGAAPSPELRLGSGAIAWMPHPRSNMAVVEWDDHIYGFGGRGFDAAESTAWDFDPYMRRFRELPPMPAARMGHAAMVCGSRILIFGGMRDTTYDTDIAAFDPQTRTWSSAGTMPFARARFGMAGLDGKVWIAGGSDASGRSAEVWTYEPKTQKWERKADLPDARDRLALVPLGGMLYALGGETPEGKGSATCWRYSPSDDKWTKISSLAHARKNLAATRLGNEIVVAGGWNIIDDEKVFPSRIEVYDPQVKDWLKAGELESPRDGARAVTWRGRVLIFGGFNGDALTSVEATQWVSAHSGWSVDESLKFHLATFTDRELSASPKTEDQKTLKFTTPATPDITNIGLAAIRSLGFPLPARGDEAGMTFFLKFFEYPTQMGQEASVRRAVAPYLLSGTSGWDMVASLVRSVTGVVVKKGLIAPTSTVFDDQHPFPPLRVPTEEIDGMLAQEWFDRTIVFSSLYVRPKGRQPAGDPAGTSTGGVAAYAPESLALLGRSYRPISGPDPKLAYFLDDSESDQAADAPRYSVVRTQKTPSIFPNWKDLPMPQDPAHVFLSGLLLQFCDDYKGTPVTSAADVKAPATRSTVFEIGSVVHTDGGPPPEREGPPSQRPGGPPVAPPSGVPQTTPRG